MRFYGARLFSALTTFTHALHLSDDIWHQMQSDARQKCQIAQQIIETVWQIFNVKCDLCFDKKKKKQTKPTNCKTPRNQFYGAFRNTTEKIIISTTSVVTNYCKNAACHKWEMLSLLYRQIQSMGVLFCCFCLPSVRLVFYLLECVSLWLYGLFNEHEL